MPPKKTDSKSEAAAAKPKATGSQHTYQVRNHDTGLLKLFPCANRLQDMITDAIVSVFPPVPFLPAHVVLAPRWGSRMRRRS